MSDPAAKRLGAPTAVTVRTGQGGIPAAVNGAVVEAVREEWVVEDRWWTAQPVRRRYFDLVLSDGRDISVFCDIGRRRWFSQRA
ncbi:MAG: hypothetical protein ACR2HC_04135 [Thermoleophilaceae bacterium]